MTHVVLRNQRISTQEFEGARRAWFRTARKAKRACWEELLQTGKEEDTWKAISGKQAHAPFPPHGAPGLGFPEDPFPLKPWTDTDVATE